MQKEKGREQADGGKAGGGGRLWEPEPPPRARGDVDLGAG